jgi:hypothetical protein
MLLAMQPIKIMTKVVFLKKIVWKYFKPKFFLFLECCVTSHPPDNGQDWNCSNYLVTVPVVSQM